MSQRKIGQSGRVRITSSIPESVIPEATSQSCIWSPSSQRDTVGFLLYQSVEQWEELSSLLTKEAWIPDVYCVSNRDGSLSIPLQVCTQMTFSLG